MIQTRRAQLALYHYQRLMNCLLDFEDPQSFLLLTYDKDTIILHCLLMRYQKQHFPPSFGGKWEFVKVPFGLNQAPAYFMALINKVLEGCEEFALGYMDDILIFSPDERTHLIHIEVIFEQLQKAKLKLKMSWKHLFFFLLVTRSGVGSTFQVLVFGWNSKLLVYLEVRDRIVDSLFYL